MWDVILRPTESEHWTPMSILSIMLLKKWSVKSVIRLISPESKCWSWYKYVHPYLSNACGRCMCVKLLIKYKLWYNQEGNMWYEHSHTNNQQYDRIMKKHCIKGFKYHICLYKFIYLMWKPPVKGWGLEYLHPIILSEL